jgi:hypothetical protein
MGAASVNAPLMFPTKLPDDARWIAVTVKICELCGKTFLRDAQQKECKRCTAILAKPAEPIPGMTQEEAEGHPHWERQSSTEIEGVRGPIRYPAVRAAAKERERKRRLELWKKQTQQQAARKISERTTIQ